MSNDKWIDEDFPNYEVVQLDSHDTQNESLTIKELPEFPKPPEKSTLKKSFDVDTTTIMNRIKKTFLPFGTESLFENGVPDLYIPFWSITTLVLIMSIISIQLSHPIKMLVTVASLIYFLSVIVPLLLSCYISNITGSSETVELVSVHGYSYIHFIIPTIFSVFKNAYILWILWLLGLGYSLFFLKKNLWKFVSELHISNQIVSSSIICVGHLCLLLTANLYFLKS